MDFPRASKSPSEFLGGLKDRLGFGDGRDRRDEYDDFYDEFDEYAPSEDQAYDDYEPEGNVDPYDRLEYTTRSKAGTPARSASRVSSPRLVDARDIRASIAAPTAQARSSAQTTSRMSAAPASHRDDPLPPTTGLDSPVTGYTDFVSPYQGHAAAAPAATSAPASNRGLDSLFEPTTGAAASAQATSVLTTTAAPAATAPTYTSAAADYAGTAASHLDRRLTVVAPQTYEDVSSVARSVRLGYAVILSLRRTGDGLSKRVLDFSFGVASALEARVDCVGDQTFAILQGEALTQEEKQRLQQQGVL